MLYHLPIEPYENRYTADWIQQFETEFKEAGIDYATVLGEAIKDKIEQGSVLDACGTHVYKFSQLAELIMRIDRGDVKDGDVIFFNDLWFPGLESLFYIRDITRIDFKVAGILHAGTYDPADFTARTGMRPWGKYIEKGWFAGIDLIFVATNFHKSLILKNTPFNYKERQAVEEKIKVTGIPFYAEDFAAKESKENIVVFPHRIEIEKHPERFEEFSTYEEASDYMFIKTIEETKTRDEYFDLLGRSKIMLSFADQETFGYSTLEAMASGNVVIVPNKLSYMETVPKEYRYNDLTEAKELFIRAINGELRPNYPDIYKWEKAFKNMHSCMKKRGWNV